MYQILAMGCQSHGYFRNGIFYDNLLYHSLSGAKLMPTLVRFFIGTPVSFNGAFQSDRQYLVTDVEMTGGHTQFWDKFNIR